MSMSYSKEMKAEVKMYDYAIRDRYSKIIGIKEDAPSDVKAAYKRYMQRQKKIEAYNKKTGGDLRL